MRTHIIALLILIGVYFLHVFGMEGAYVRIWWLDILSHSLVCFAIALFIGALLFSLFPQVRFRITLIVLGTFFVGFMWEWLETYYNLIGHPLWSYAYYFDTIKDLIVDTLSAIVAALLLIKFRRPRPVSVPIQN